MSSSVSIRARLNNIARKENISFQVIIVRYIHERLLYRLSVSPYVNQFLLKGGNFIYAIQGLSSRPTTDIEFLGKELSNDIDLIKTIFAEIGKIQCLDAVWFDTQNILTEPIAEQNQYNGVRLKINAGFDTVEQQMQIDVGFGDKVTPNPIKLQYPVLLEEVPTPNLFAYTPETVIAEKFQAMIALSGINSRMKDFYDVYHLLQTIEISEDNLNQAIEITFKNRNTILNRDHSIFTEDFRNDPNRLTMWKAYLKKIKKPNEITFQEVMQTIRDRLMPLL